MANTEVQNVLLLVDPTPDLTRAASLALIPGGTPPSEVTLPELPAGFVLDLSFPPIPISREGAQNVQMFAGEGRAPGGLVVRGQIAKSDIDRATGQRPGRLFADPFVEAMPTTCGGTPPVGVTADVERLLDCARMHAASMDGNGVAIAIVDGGVNLAHLRAAPRSLTPSFSRIYSWSASPAVTPGSAPLGHGTMCAYDALIAAPNSILLDYVTLVRGIMPGGPALAGLLSDAVRAFSQLMAAMMIPVGVGGRPFDSLVVSNSWGVFDPGWDFPAGHAGRYIDNLRHPFNIVTSALALSGADIVFAAGNCGPVCPDGRCGGWAVGAPIISGANSHPEVLCTAGVDTNKAIVGYSSKGPGALHANKPDLAAYTHFLGSEAFGVGQPDSGTSAACPVLAGTVAALRSLYPYDPAKPQRTPAHVNTWLRHNCGVHPSRVTGWVADLGFGIIDTRAFAPGVVALS